MRPYTFRTTIRALGFSSLMALYNVAAYADNDPINRVVAVVDNSVILQSELSTALSTAAATPNAASMPPEQLKPLVLKQLILKKLQTNLLARSSIQISEEQLTSALQTIASQQGSPDLVSFQQTLDAQKSGQYAALRRQVREELSLEQLRRQRVSARVNITDQQIARFLKSPQSQDLFKPEYHLESVVLSPLNPAAIAPNTTDTTPIINKIKAALDTGTSTAAIVTKQQSKLAALGWRVNGGDMGWKKADDLPTPFAKSISGLGKGQATEAINADKEIYFFRLVESRGAGSAVLIPQHQVSHILVKTTAGVTDELAKFKIDDIYSKLQHGADFATLAGTYSDDTGSAALKGDLGWVSAGEMVAPFEAMMNHTAIGDYSAPFKTQFGWHILKVFAERQHDVTEQYRQNAARNAIFARQYDQALDDWLKEMYAAAYIDIKP